MRSSLDRRLARVEQAAARQPSLYDALRTMSDEELIAAVQECHRKIEAFHDLDPRAILPG